jgi:hypothetical protein
MKRDSSAYLWARLLDLINTTPELLCDICKHLSQSEQEALRGVNRAMRLAINATVSRVSWPGSWRGQGGLQPQQQLHAVFPNLTALSGGDMHDLDRARDYLYLLASSSCPLLLHNLQHLGLEVPAAMTVAPATTLIWQLVRRYE